MVRFLLLKTTDLAIGEYIVMQHPNLFNCQLEALPTNGRQRANTFKSLFIIDLDNTSH